MAQHSNYAQDRDLMMEAYGSVKGIIPPTQSTAPARLYTEAHCDEEHEGGEETVKVTLDLELDKETATDLHDQLMDEVVPAEDSSCMSDEEHGEDGEHVEDNEGEEQGEDFFDALDDVLMIIGSGDLNAVVAGVKVKLGKKELSSHQLEAIENVVKDAELPDDDPYKGEGDAEGYQGYR